MQQARRQSSILGSASMLVVLVAAWIALAPEHIGGQAFYVIVAGNSMEPVMHRGDLVIIRQTERYAAGDVVTYRHPSIGPIIHRILERKGDRFVFKGDNNAWIDSYEPVQAELIGKLWLRIPAAGRWIELLRQPRMMALGAGVIGVLFMATFGAGLRQRKRAAAGQPAGTGALAAQTLGKLREGLLFCLGVAALASLLLTGLAFTRPTLRSVVEDVPYEQRGSFDYSAPAPSGLYDSSSLTTGQPVFLQLNRQVTVNFSYQLQTDAPVELSGSYLLAAELIDQSGWRRIIELQPETSFSGSSFVASGVLDLSRVQALIEQFERQTGVQRQQYHLALVPQVRVSGSIAGQPLEQSFAPRLEFQLDDLQLQLLGGGTAAGENPLAPVSQGLLKQTQLQPNQLSLLGLSLPVTTARMVGSIGLVVALLALLALAGLTLRLGRRDQAAQIALKYAPQLVEVRGLVLQPGDRLVEVSTIEGLVQLAQRDNRSILHATHEGQHSYFVQDTGVTYSYQPASQDGLPTLVLEDR